MTPRTEFSTAQLEPGSVRAAEILIAGALYALRQYRSHGEQLPADIVEFVRGRLSVALEQLAIEAPDRHCIFCGCTDVDPCEVPIELVDPAQLRAIAPLVSRRGIVSKTIPCSWMPVPDAVCSHPTCVAEYMRQWIDAGGDPSALLLGDELVSQVKP